jgi:hypothetical protein
VPQRANIRRVIARRLNGVPAHAQHVLYIT